MPTSCMYRASRPTASPTKRNKLLAPGCLQQWPTGQRFINCGFFFTFHFGSSKGCVQPQSLVRISRCDVKIKSFFIKALRAFFQQHLGHPWSTPIKRSCHGNDLRKAGGMWSTTCIKATTIPSVMPCWFCWGPMLHKRSDMYQIFSSINISKFPISITSSARPSQIQHLPLPYIAGPDLSSMVASQEDTMSRFPDVVVFVQTNAFLKRHCRMATSNQGRLWMHRSIL